MMRALTAPRVLAFCMLMSLGGVGFALVAQYQFNIKPCPWCVMQRGIYLLIALVSGLGLVLHRFPAARVIALLGTAALGVLGMVAAGYQHEVASKLASCDMTFADHVLTALELESRWPLVFMATATCSEAATYTLLGVTYDIWSGLLFTFFALLCLLTLRRGRAHARR